MMYLAVIVAVTLLSAASSVTAGKAGRKVAFSAVLASSRTINVNQVVVYDYVNINEGGGYNNSTGIFTAPRGGIYMFHIHAAIYSDTYAVLNLFKNTVIISTVYIRNANTYDTTGNSVIVKVDKGDTVFVKSATTAYFWSSTTNQYTSFNGYLI